MSLLKNAEYAFWKKNQNLLKDNQKFSNIHKGQTCYIIANGGSIKFYDLSILSNLPTIGCTYSLIDNRLKGSGLSYCVFPSAYLLLPLWKSRQNGKIEINSLAPIFRKIIRENNGTQFFMSLTDRYSFIRIPENVNFIYHFGNKKFDSFDMSGAFSFVSSGLDFMLGVAKYLGFSKTVLLGCDYLGEPCMEGHFYSTREQFTGEYKVQYVNHIRNIVNNLEMDVVTIFPSGVKSPEFESMSYHDYFGVNETFYNQSQIVDDEYLDMLKKADSKGQLFL